MRTYKIPFGEFNSGMDDSDLLAKGRGDVSYLENVELGAGGVINQGDCYTEFAEALGDFGTGMFKFEETPGTYRFFAVKANQYLRLRGATTWSDEGEMTSWGKTAWTNAGSWYNNQLAGMWGVASAKNYLVLAGLNSTGNATLYKWSSTDSPKLSALGASSPGGRLLLRHGFRMLVSGNDEYPNRVWWSGINDCQTWEATGFVNVGAQKEADTVQALLSVGSRLFVFKKRALWVISGDTPSAWVSKKAFDKGTIAPNAIVQHGAAAIFVDTDGIYVSDGGEYKLLGLTKDGIWPIKNWWDNNIIEANLNKAVAYVVGSKLYIGLSTSGSYNNCILVYDFNRQTFVVYTIHKPSCFGADTVSGVERLYYAETVTPGKVRHFDPSVTTLTGTDYFVARTKAWYYPMMKGEGIYGGKLFIPKIKLLFENKTGTHTARILGDYGNQVKEYAVAITQDTDFPTQAGRVFYVHPGIYAKNVQVEVKSQNQFGFRGGVVHVKPVKDTTNY